MPSDRPKCEYCGKEFENVEDYQEHQENEHGATTSIAEQKLAGARNESSEAHGPSDQADRLVGYGEAEHDHGETEAPDRTERDVHRPPVPGPD